MSANLEHFEKLYRKINIEDLILKVRNVKDFLADAIATDTSWHGMYVNSFQERIKGKKVLELGSGDGLNALIMAALGAQVVAVDISPQSERLIKEAGKKLGLTNLKALSGDFIHMPFEADSFDFIIGKAFLHHLTHELENDFLQKTAFLLKSDGEARFVEPAVNSKALDFIRYLIPVPGRPSILCQPAFAQWRQNDPHPVRDNSSNHFIINGKNFFREVQIILLGSLERLHRIMRIRRFERPYRRWAHKTEPYLPYWFKWYAARSQTVIYRRPVAIQDLPGPTRSQTTQR